MASSTQQLRNIGIVAHINAGKTTLTERILFDSGVQSFMGEVDEGTATMDWMVEEQRRGISITAAITHVDWGGYRVNLIDTPGHVDFTAEVERCLRVLDGVVVVLDAVRGVESQTEMIWRQVEAFGIPRLVFVNKMDRETADFAGSVVALVERLGCRALPLALPVRKDGRLQGLVDVVHDVVRGKEPEGGPGWELSRQAVVEVCADYDEEIMRDFVDGRFVAEPRLTAALRRAVLACEVVPVLAGAALPNRGVDLLLDAVCRYLPSPLDRPVLTDASGGTVRRLKVDHGAPFCGLLFKVQIEGGDRLYYVRVYCGTLRVGDTVGSSRHPGEARIEAIWAMHAMHREEVPEARAGDVVVVAMPAAGELRTGESLFDPGHPVTLAPLHFPPPVLTRSLEAARGEDADELEAAARSLVGEDPTLVLSFGADTGGLLVSGMGELHLQVFGQRLQAALGCDVRLGAPQVLRRETVTQQVEARGECRRHLDGEERSTVVRLVLEPVPGLGPAAVGDVDLEPALAQKVRDLLESQVRMGLRGTHPAQDLKVHVSEVVGGVSGPDGEAMLGAALAIACRKAAAEAGVVTLEPSMGYDIHCPAETLSAVLADLNARGAQIHDVKPGVGDANVRGRVALGRVLGYTTRLRSMTRGLGTMSLTPVGFEPVLENG
jgi:elongation factor G